jgi:hypothetical protein
MKITKSQLKQLIKEELESVLAEENKSSSDFLNNNTALYLNKARAAKTTEETLKHILTAVINLNNKHAGVFPRIQEMFNTTQRALDKLDDRIYKLEQERLANFKKAFKKAKDAKKGRFTFGGEEYTTDLK